MASLKRLRAEKRDGERGSELIELAIVLPIFLLIIMGIVDFGFLFQRYEVVTNAAREGARLASLDATYSDPDIRLRVQNYLSAGGLDPATATITPGPAVSTTVGSIVVTTRTVTVLYPTTMMFIPQTVNLQSVSTMRVEGGS